MRRSCQQCGVTYSHYHDVSRNVPGTSRRYHSESCRTRAVEAYCRVERIATPDNDSGDYFDNFVDGRGF